jgi:hypothetical protein
MREVHTRRPEYPKRAQRVVVVLAAAVFLLALGTWFLLGPRVVEMDRARIRALVMAVDPTGLGYSWRYHGTKDGFHYLQRSEDRIIYAPSRHYRIAERELPVPRPFEFRGWRSREARRIFARGDGDGPWVDDPEWLEPPHGFPE